MKVDEQGSRRAVAALNAEMFERGLVARASDLDVVVARDDLNEGGCRVVLSRSGLVVVLEWRGEPDEGMAFERHAIGFADVDGHGRGHGVGHGAHGGEIRCSGAAWSGSRSDRRGWAL